MAFEQIKTDRVFGRNPLTGVAVQMSKGSFQFRIGKETMDRAGFISGHTRVNVLFGNGTDFGFVMVQAARDGRYSIKKQHNGAACSTTATKTIPDWLSRVHHAKTVRIAPENVRMVTDGIVFPLPTEWLVTKSEEAA